MAGEIAREHGGSDFRWAARAEDRNKLWQARHDAYYAGLALRPAPAAADRCLRADLAAGRVHRRDQARRAGEPACSPRWSAMSATAISTWSSSSTWTTPTRWRAPKPCTSAWSRRAMAMGGTCTGEHGIGYGKKHLLEAECGPAVDVMRTIKQALDPSSRP
jgi:D-lactate dehydrogenase (cytochrome)